ncbi:MAG: transglutaminase domain-containing protein [Methanoregula sp.]
MKLVIIGELMIWSLTKKQKTIGIFLLIIVIFFIPCVWYFFEVKPHVDLEINSFEENISQIKDPQLRIREVANFTEKNYEQAYNRPRTPSILSSRLLFGFTNNPYFVAYYKAGACGESASLFNFYAIKSGFESRMVKTPAEDHVWNEIKINNRWVQADPTIYYYAYSDPKNYSDYNNLWFDTPTAYSTLGWNKGYSRVVVVDTNEDLTTKYCNISKISIFCQGCNHIKIKPDIGTGFSVDQDIKNSETTFVLGKKDYTIIAEKNIIPFLLVQESNVSVSLLDTDHANVTIIPDKILPTIYSQLICILGIFTILCVGIWIIIKKGIQLLEKYLKRQE